MSLHLVSFGRKSSFAAVPDVVVVAIVAPDPTVAAVSADVVVVVVAAVADVVVVAVAADVVVAVTADVVDVVVAEVAEVSSRKMSPSET